MKRIKKNNPKVVFEEYEKALYDMGFSCICGVDEVGRGPWAGPITACAVVVDPKSNNRLKKMGVIDSKKLDDKMRKEIHDILVADNSIIYSIANVSAKEIDEIGLGRANHLVLRRAIEGLPNTPDYILVDGFIIKEFNMRHERIIKGDQKVLSIATASIIAKVHRDHYMVELSKKYPGYGFEKHKGYGTKEHRVAIKNLGICDEHRRSFKPIAEIIQKLNIDNENDR